MTHAAAAPSSPAAKTSSSVMKLLVDVLLACRDSEVSYRCRVEVGVRVGVLSVDATEPPRELARGLKAECSFRPAFLTRVLSPLRGESPAPPPIRGVPPPPSPPPPPAAARSRLEACACTGVLATEELGDGSHSLRCTTGVAAADARLGAPSSLEGMRRETSGEGERDRGAGVRGSAPPP
eukprot:CAMPEP_0182879508 /NCGR_PEP_ID=MMETSP0034_2-20130328/16017_1 /TAXON_ID=156128 /ORGANISM="Nephroselmis pyriformis, Strain CCMP717" /LENGTH=179 /DNA_ID=CAMNT_0025012451 /DNA_START=181 /DNA_END=716 /DNA_ORIENTATION=+